MNFPLILVLATVAMGVIWLVDAILFAPKRRARQSSSGKDADLPILVEYAQSFFPVLLVVLVLRSFLFEPFRIPSGSMIPTLLVGDFILVNKFSYGLRLPVLHTKILDTGLPERGDVAVFRYPKDPSFDYIKRVVGLPGDEVTFEPKIFEMDGKQYIQDTFTINGEEIVISGGEPYVMPNSGDISPGETLRTELLGDVEHNILVQTSQTADAAGRNVLNGGHTWTVPEGHYMMFGDNRDNSNDSRYWGFVPEENLVGKANYIWMHWHEGILWDRLGNRIK